MQQCKKQHEEHAGASIPVCVHADPHISARRTDRGSGVCAAGPRQRSQHFTLLTPLAAGRSVLGCHAQVGEATLGLNGAVACPVLCTFADSWALLAKNSGGNEMKTHHSPVL
jgi:hypothetical protein